MPIQPPYGLAETIARLQAQRVNPLMQVLSTLGNTGADVLNGLTEAKLKQQQGTVPTAGAVGLGVPGNGYPGVPLPAGQAGPVQPRSAQDVFGPRMDRTLVDSYLAGKNRMDQQTLKGNQAAGQEGTKLNLPVTDTIRAVFEKAKRPLKPDQTTIRHEEYDAAVKEVLQSEKPKPKDTKTGQDPNKVKIAALKTRLSALDKQEKGLQTILHPLDSVKIKGSIQQQRDEINQELQKIDSSEGGAKGGAASSSVDDIAKGAFGG